MKYKPEVFPEMIRKWRERFESGKVAGSMGAHGYRGEQGGRALGKLHDQIALRRAHFFNLPDVDPLLPDPYSDAPGFQSDAPRQLHEQLLARITENHANVRAEADEPTATKRKGAQVVEEYLQGILDAMEKRNGYTFQEGMGDAQIIDGVGLIHWWYAPDRDPDWPDYEYRDDLRDTDAETKKRFRPNPEYTEGSVEETHSRRLREREESVRERRAKMLANAPDVYDAEVLSARNCYWLDDRTSRNGLGRVMVIREYGWLDYDEDLKERDLKVYLKDGKIQRWADSDTPHEDGPSADGWDTNLSVVTIWTKDEWYELAAVSTGGTTQDWEYITGGTHDWGMPPFALFTAITAKDPDPTLMYQPALAGVFRLKPFVDEQVTLMHVIARNTAMPWFYLEKKDDGAKMLDEAGKMATFTMDAALAMAIPDGYELKWMNPEMGAAMPQSIALFLDDYKAAYPSTGTTDTSASSQPWTIRLKQTEANVTPGMLIRRQMQPMDIFLEAVARDCARRAKDEPDEQLWGYVKDDGKKALKAIPAADLEGFKIHVDIDGTGEAERVTMAQIGMQELGMELITPYNYWDEYKGDPDPQKRIDELVAYKAYRDYWEPGIIRQEIARIQGSDTIKNVSLGVNGETIGPNGQAITPEEVVGINGFQPATPVQGMTVDQPDMSPLAAPGTVPVQV